MSWLLLGSFVQYHFASGQKQQTHHHREVYRGRVPKNHWVQFFEGTTRPWVPYIDKATEDCTKIGQGRRFFEDLVTLKMCIYDYSLMKILCKHNMVDIIQEESVPCIHNKITYANPYHTDPIIFTQTMWEPFGQECLISTRTVTEVKHFVNNQKVIQVVGTHFVRYVLDGYHIFGFNITFVRFILSDRCHFEGDNSHCDFFAAESLLLKQYIVNFTTKFDRYSTFYYCMRRPIWSVFTKSRVNIEYTPSPRTYFYRLSEFVINYQVITGNVILSSLDQFHKLLQPFKSFNQTFLPEIYHVGCNQSTLYKYIFIGQKYEKIKIVHFLSKLWLEKPTFPSFILLSDKTTVAVDYFFCFVYAMFTWSQSGKSNKYENITYKFSSALQVKKHDVAETEKNLTPCADVYPCHQIHLIQTPKYTYAHILIETMPDPSFITKSCILGGVAIYDGKTLMEIYTQCDIHTNSISYLQTMYLQAVPLVMSSRKTLLIAYTYKSMFYMSISITATFCMGVFINICSHESYPKLHFFQDHRGAIRVVANLQNLDTTGSCVTYQLSAMYFIQRMRTTAGKVCVFSLDMSKKFNHSMTCRGKVHYQKIYSQSSLESYLSRFFPETLSMSSKVLKTTSECHVKTPSCKTDLSYNHFKKQFSSVNEFLVSTIKTPHAPENGAFQCTVYTQVQAFRTQIHDVFHVIRSAVKSDEFWMFSIHNDTCFADDAQSVKTTFHTDRRELCLKEKFYPDHDMVLSLSLDGNLSGLLGKVQMHTSLCLSATWVQSVVFTDRSLSNKILKRTCLEKYDLKTYGFDPNNVPNNMGEDTLQWSSDLFSCMFDLNQNNVPLALLGSILYAAFEFKNMKKPSDNSYFFRYKWTKNSKHLNHKQLTESLQMTNLTVKGRHFFAEEHLYTVVSPDLTKAHRKCQQSDGHLPVLTSKGEVEVFIEFVVRASWNTLVSKVFIGLYGKVSPVLTRMIMIS